MFIYKLAGSRSVVGRAPNSYARGPGFDTRPGHIFLFLLPLIQEGAVASYWRKYVHEELVNRLGGLILPRKSVVRLADRPFMTLDVYRGRKTTTQQQYLQSLKENSCLRNKMCTSHTASVVDKIHCYC